ncbi:SRPBCC family protein [Pseudonocardia asaccharolytica]|uniref:Carbon monoxide dehydrogenase subunit G n=1 Tax=Pseudonocardia asaccharolytica DSM 44247 = NBRC 16224 TaxID=1123024 RepID=A0A511CXQ3_9PSEU|nr:SRPBCC family protein [Pseudonocardia asaccharolytica]GEL17033.1 hypothetical protein PA7_08700 [Pseudonocardia asaccharolytica DSM 44247 = NBRC 16224]
MQLENKFTIAAPIEEAWAALNNPETVAPCFPGATLDSYESDAFTGTVKVKLGPISLTYKGKGTYVSRDDAKHEVVIDANGRDARGNGTANAKVTGTMQADGPDKTEVTMVTDLTITGRPAQFGRGVISDVSEKIIGQFASCLTEKLGDKAPAVAAEPATNGAAEAKPAEVKPAEVKPTGPVRSEVEAIDLLDTAGAPVLKRLAPVIGGALLLLIILLIRRSRSR